MPDATKAQGTPAEMAVVAPTLSEHLAVWIKKVNARLEKLEKKR